MSDEESSQKVRFHVNFGQVGPFVKTSDGGYGGVFTVPAVDATEHEMYLRDDPNVISYSIEGESAQTPYCSKYLPEAKDFGRIEDFQQYKKEVVAAISKAFKSLDKEMTSDSGLLGRDKPRKGWSDLDVMSLLQDMFTRDNQDLNITVKKGPNSVVQLVYKNGERQFYTHIMIPADRFNSRAMKNIVDRITALAKKNELQDYETQDDIHYNKKSRRDREHFGSPIQESRKKLRESVDPDAELITSFHPVMKISKEDIDWTLFYVNMDTHTNLGVFVDAQTEQDAAEAAEEWFTETRPNGAPWEVVRIQEVSHDLIGFQEAKDRSVDIGDGFYVHGKGMDDNGNSFVLVSKGANKPVRIQTNQNIPSAHRKSVEEIVADEKAKAEIKDFYMNFVHRKNRSRGGAQRRTLPAGSDDWKESKQKPYQTRYPLVENENVSKFRSEYVKQLTADAANSPEEYGFSSRQQHGYKHTEEIPAEVEKTVDRMITSLKKGGANNSKTLQRVAKKLGISPSLKSIQKYLSENGNHGITLPALQDRIAAGNKESGTDFYIGGSYGNYDLWARTPDGGEHRLESGSKRDIYNAWVKYRFDPKFRVRVINQESRKNKPYRSKYDEEVVTMWHDGVMQFEAKDTDTDQVAYDENEQQAVKKVQDLSNQKRAGK